jgi:Thermophilic metalloprotease (M29)
MLAASAARRVAQWEAYHSCKRPGYRPDTLHRGPTFLNDNGKRNFLGGEFFTSPVETRANVYIRFSFPASYGGRSVADVRLRFQEFFRQYEMMLDLC